MSWRWILVVLVLSGCQHNPQSLQEARERSLAELDSAERYSAHHLAEQPTVSFSERFYAPPIQARDQLKPGWYSTEVNIELREFPLQRALQRLLAPHQLAVRFLDDIDSDQLVSVRHQGTIGGALEQIGRDTGFSFVVEDQLVTWSKFRVAEFDVAFLAGNTNFFLGDSAEANSVQQSRSGAMPAATGINANNRQFLNFSSQDLSVWDDLEQALTMLLSTSGELSINQSSTSVLVRDYPQYVDQVEHYLNQQNQRLTRQIAMDIKVLEVTFNEREQTAIDWQLVRQANGIESVLNVAGQLLGSSSTSGQGLLNLQRNSGAYAGSGALLQALQEQGVVQVSNHPRLLSLNNQIAKIVLEDNATYLASAGTTSTANVGSSDVLTPGVITTGFELYVLPKATQGQVILQLSTSLSDLQSIDEVRSGDMLIQTPHTNRKNFFMKAMVANGETLLLSGLKNSRKEQREQQSFGSWLFGGGQRDQHMGSETLLLITPHIIERTL